MTTYSDYDTSQYLGAPVEGYKFTLPAVPGVLTPVYLTNADEFVDMNGQTYSPCNITRTDLECTVFGDQPPDIKITIPIKHGLAKILMSRVMPAEIRVDIIRGHRTTDMDLHFEEVWGGPITGFAAEGEYFSMRSTSMTDNIGHAELPNYIYQNLCGHTLYSDACGLNRGTYYNSGTIVNVDNLSIQFNKTAGASYSDSRWPGGMLYDSTSDEWRHIVYATGDIFQISYPYYNMRVGDSYIAYLGCDHSYSDCNNFANTANFGGMPYIPYRNPYKSEV
jgi:hypothetical protein